jgi:hypothetical protein
MAFDDSPPFKLIDGRLGLTGLQLMQDPALNKWVLRNKGCFDWGPDVDVMFLKAHARPTIFDRDSELLAPLHLAGAMR